MSGSGRTVLTKIAAWMKGLRVYNISITKLHKVQSWREEIKKLVFFCGVNNISYYLQINENMILRDSYLEDLANLMNIGEVPNLLTPEDWEEITNIYESTYKDKTLHSNKNKLFDIFRKNIRKNLKVVLNF